ncbi:MAG TPA: hypothetical protein VHE30_22225, partial [Polyangiaceae bacterium]|nr:hypothetical protein [Polyangiaceae bacterium]
ELVLGLEDPVGWEAAVLDHFTVVVRTIVSKLARETRARLSDESGGSTYHFTIYRGHPHEQEVLGELSRFRQRMSTLRDRVNRYNADNGLPGTTLRVDAYYGQQVVEESHGESESEIGF